MLCKLLFLTSQDITAAISRVKLFLDITAIASCHIHIISSQLRPPGIKIRPW